MKVSELEGAALDYWAAKADNWFVRNEIPESKVSLALWIEWGGCDFAPSTRWEDCGPIIERERIMLAHGELNSGPAWVAHYGVGSGAPHRGIGKTPLGAVMRCFVASKFGVEVPDA